MLRRTFLKFLGAAPLGLGAQAERLAGLNPGVGAVLGYSGVGTALADGVGGVAASGAMSHYARAAAYFALNAAPAFVAERARDQVRANVTRLDADLAANRSFSLSTKFRMQVDREVERSLAATVRTARRNIVGEAFRQTHGFDIW